MLSKSRIHLLPRLPNVTGLETVDQMQLWLLLAGHALVAACLLVLVKMAQSQGSPL